MEEIWKNIEEFEGYKISNMGRVYSEKVGRILKANHDNKGYLRVKFSVHNKFYTRKVHRLVAQAFIPNPNNLPQVNHKDEVKDNNRVDNLEWCDNYYNVNYGTKSERSGKALTNREDESIPVLCVETGIVYPSIREAYRQTKAKNIYMCCSGERNTSGGYHWKYASNLRRINGKMQNIAANSKNTVEVGDKVYLPNERNGYIVQARNDRYIICTKKVGRYVKYFIIDLVNKWRAPDNQVFCSGYESIEQCEERLKELQQGVIELSRRRGIPLDIDIA